MQTVGKTTSQCTWASEEQEWLSVYRDAPRTCMETQRPCRYTRHFVRAQEVTGCCQAQGAQAPQQSATATRVVNKRDGNCALPRRASAGAATASSDVSGAIQCTNSPSRVGNTRQKRVVLMAQSHTQQAQQMPCLLGKGYALLQRASCTHSAQPAKDPVHDPRIVLTV